MAKFSILAGTTSKLLRLFVQNTSQTNGAGLTGLAFGTSGLTCYYIREGDAATTAITLQTATLGTWTTRGFIVVDATNMPGVYEFGIPDAAVAAGAKSVLVYFQGAANMAPTLLEIELTAVNNQSTSFGLVLTGLTVGTVTTVTDLTGTAYPEASGVVAASATLKDSIVWLKTLSRNKITQTATTETLFADDTTTPVAASTDSDNGTTFTRGEWA